MTPSDPLARREFSVEHLSSSPGRQLFLTNEFDILAINISFRLQIDIANCLVRHFGFSSFDGRILGERMLGDK